MLKKANIILSTKKVVNVKELATLTGLSVGYIYNLVSGRKIPHYKSDGGKLTFFKVQEIEEWLCAEKVTTIKDLENNYNPDEIEQLKQLLNTKLNELRNAEKIARSIR